MQADEYVVPAFDLDDLSNFFLDCVFQYRKSLRHQLITMKGKNKDQSLLINISSSKTASNVFNNSLLNTYMSTVKTGS